MKTFAALAIVVTVVTLGSAARGQTCYAPVTSFQGNYSLSATSGGSVSCPAGTCTVNDGAVVNVTPSLAGITCSEGYYYSGPALIPDVISKLTISDTSVTPCPPFPPLTTTLTGTGTGSSFSELHIYSSGTLTYVPAPQGDWTETVTGCSGGGGSSNGKGYDLYPLSNWPLTFALPATVEPLTFSPPPFKGQDEFAGVNLPWTFSFTLNPIYDDDDDCKEDGNSSIGCVNQSLGEDVPIVGTGFNLHYESGRAPGAGGNSTAATDAFMIGGWTLSVHHAYDPGTNTLFRGDGQQRNGYQMGTPVGYNGNYLFTSEDGSEVYVFTAPSAQHLQTLRPLTGALEYQFGYDSAGKLVTVTDATGNVTTIERNASEQPTAIVSPYGQATTLAVDSNGFLSQLIDPLGKSIALTHTSQGLLISRTDQNGNIFTYDYDAQGRLIKDADSLGGYIALTRTPATSGFGWTTNETTSLGRTSSYQATLSLPWQGGTTSTTSKQRTITWPNGLKATTTKTQTGSQLSNGVTLPDGSSASTTEGPDPRWGIQVPIETSSTLTLGSLAMNSSESRTATLGTPGNPFSLTTQTDTITVNGRVYTSAFTGSNLTYLNTTPVGRTTKVTLDSLERVVSAQVGKLTAINLTYDTRGRIASVMQGTRTMTFGYDTNGFLVSVLDPLKRKFSFTHDVDERLVTSTLPDGRVINYAYDANGNLTSITPPGKSTHDFSYSAVDLPTMYAPPTVPGTGATTYAYDLDRDLTTITRPDGKTTQFNYDSAGRLSSIATPTETIKYAYNSTTGNLSSEVNGAEEIAYAYNGPLPTSSTWTGTVAGSVSRAYNTNFWATSQAVKGGSRIAFSYDNDGLLTKAGALSLKRSSTNGLITGTALGSATDTRVYDPFGDLSDYTASYGVTALYSVKFTRDAGGRVTSKSETIGGTTNSFVYTYDLAGRLVRVTENGTSVDSYAYDTNSNRVKAVTPSGTVNGTYDAQDRLLTYGNSSYTYTANGELASQTVNSQSTSYQYDVLGNLISATLPNGTKITYIVDPENHRVGKQVNGVLTAGYLYSRNRIVAQLNGSNAVVSQFIYASGASAPDYMLTGSVSYRIFSDQLGSPRLVLNTATGAIAEQIAYDEFGNVVSDTNPGFQPFGFAGGLYDQDTKLLRFGARDYSAAVGRWTAKDPILFEGGDLNLYGYVLNDPVNEFDFSGLQASGSTAGATTIPGPTTDGIRVDLNAPLVEGMMCNPNDFPPPERACTEADVKHYRKYGKISSPCVIMGDSDPFDEHPILHKITGWIEKILSGSTGPGSKWDPEIQNQYRMSGGARG
jgi:RHS repeat-associated protein